MKSQLITKESNNEIKRKNTTNGFRRIALKFSISLILALVISSSSATFAQENDNTADRALKGSGRVNPSTLAMEISIPLGSYPGRGINVPISLSYSSKVWRMDSLEQTSTSVGGSPCFTVSHPRYGDNSASGWTTSLETPYIEYTGWTDRFTAQGFPLIERTCEEVDPPQPTAEIRRITLYMPSGETHELRMDAGLNNQGDTNRNGYYYAADGSNIVYYESSSTNTYKLMMPDGSSYELENLSSPTTVAERKATKFIDRNGNFTSYNPSTKVWTDTLGRTLSAPFGTSAPTAPEIKTYQLPGMTGEYKFHWKKLEDGLTNPSDQLKYPGDVYDAGTGGIPAYTQRPAGNALFHSNDITDNQVRNSVQLFNPVVLIKIELPTGQSYEFSYDVFGQINKIKYPTGGEETFTYQQVLPLTPVVQTWTDVSSQTNRGVQTRKLYESASAAPYEWTYSTTYTAPKGYKISIISPADILTERFLYRGSTPCQGCDVGDYGFSDAWIGVPYETRVFDALGTGGVRKLVSRNMTHWTKTSYSVGSGSADWHLRATHDESYIYDPGGNGDFVKSTVKYEYEDLSTFDKPLLRKKTLQYAFEGSGSSLSDPLPEPGESPEGNPVPMPTPTPPTLLRTTEAIYLINDPAITNSQSYKDRNMVGLVTASVVRDGAGIPVSRSEMKYDESGFSPTDYVRGNPTTSRVWDSTKGASTNSGAYIQTRAKFDSYGNQYESIDAKGNSIITTFDTTHNAFPVKVTTPIPGNGTSGSLTAFETTAEFDPITGLPLKTTDANGLRTEIEYDYDTLRPVGAKTFHGSNQVGGESETIYHDEPNNYWVKNRSQIDANNWAESITYFDGLGRAYKAEQVHSDGNIFADKEFDADGRVLRVSNPYRSGETKYWTTNVYDDAGRVIEVILPDGAKVKTDYGVSVSDVVGVTKQITDQAGKKRKGITDGLGRMVRVIEDPDGQPLNTDYVFDTLGNLRKTTQGVQNRYFSYDSLGRLLRAKQPEQDTNSNLALSTADPITGHNAWSVSYEYDNNGNITKTTDARGVYIEATYDNINRLINRNYSDPNMPDVSFFYDGTGLGAVPNFSKGKTTKVASNVSETRYTSFDVFGRILTHEQRTTAEQLTGAQLPYSTDYTYNLSGALIEETYPSGRKVKTTLNADGEFEKLESKKAAVNDYKLYLDQITRNSAGSIEKMRLGNGTWESAVYNTRQQITQIALGHSDSDKSLLKIDYGYGTPTENNGGLRQQKINYAGLANEIIQNYTYDDLNRLQAAEEKVSNVTTWEQTFQYDRYGNRTFDANNTTTFSQSNKVTNPTIQTSNNRLTEDQDGGGIDYDYDENGNLILDAENQRFVFDAENHIKSFFRGSNQTQEADATYQYDGDGKRVRKTADGIETIFVYNAGGQLVAEYSNQMPQEPKASYLTADHLGSPRIVTDGIGIVVSRHDYMAFGDEVTETVGDVGGRTPTQGYGNEDEIRQGYTGYENDKESGLEYAQARYYNASHGRFTSVDPLTASGSIRDPQTFNRYSYVLNSPYKFTDPLGLLPLGSGASGSSNQDGIIGGGGAFDSAVNGGFSLFSTGVEGYELEQHAESSEMRGPAVDENADLSSFDGDPRIRFDKIEVFDTPDFAPPPLSTTTPPLYGSDNKPTEVSIGSPPVGGKQYTFYVKVTVSNENDGRIVKSRNPESPDEFATRVEAGSRPDAETTAESGRSQRFGLTELASGQKSQRVDIKESGQKAEIVFAVTVKDPTAKNNTFNVIVQGQSNKILGHRGSLNSQNNYTGKLKISFTTKHPDPPSFLKKQP